jgi:hypothetical protein
LTQLQQLGPTMGAWVTYRQIVTCLPVLATVLSCLAGLLACVRELCALRRSAYYPGSLPASACVHIHNCMLIIKLLPGLLRRGCVQAAGAGGRSTHGRAVPNTSHQGQQQQQQQQQQRRSREQ